MTKNINKYSQLAWVIFREATETNGEKIIVAPYSTIFLTPKTDLNASQLNRKVLVYLPDKWSTSFDLNGSKIYYVNILKTEEINGITKFEKCFIPHSLLQKSEKKAIIIINKPRPDKEDSYLILVYLRSSYVNNKMERFLQKFLLPKEGSRNNNRMEKFNRYGVIKLIGDKIENADRIIDDLSRFLQVITEEK